MQRCNYVLTSLLLVATLASGCAASSKRIRAGMDPWIGQSINDLIERWGAPSAVFDMPTGGGKVYTWLYHGATLVTASYFPNLNMAMSTSGTPYCRFDWTVDAGNQIQTYRWEGQCRVLN